ncbi:PREDICTED: endoplasmic reticulum resident protein 27 [Gekko japonicus]|uniref:Endoplasmic reticulum resident protein 27 n=1 Tax=Gekko japonicus TaxID=146911 RepID=A0ABM1KSU0_GEKJA|nr:PREDICTED: endoplasmic reticulum resident protein 27 [Gekko japonicus]
MEICISRGFLVFLFSWVFLLGCAGKEPMPQGTAEDVKEPVLLADVAATDAFIRAAEVVVIGFFQDSELPEASEFLTMVQNVQDVLFGFCTSSHVLSHYNVTVSMVSLFRVVDNKRQDLEIRDSKEIDATKLGRFVRMNELRWVTEYNPLTAVGLFNSMVQTHLLLFSDKSSPNHTERMDKYQEAARLFQGKILFILVDSQAKGNDRVMSYFHLKKSQLPAVALYHVPDEEQDVLPLGEVSLEAMKDFCNSFLQRKQVKDNLELEDKLIKQEL